MSWEINDLKNALSFTGYIIRKAELYLLYVGAHKLYVSLQWRLGSGLVNHYPDFS